MHKRRKRPKISKKKTSADKDSLNAQKPSSDKATTAIAATKTSFIRRLLSAIIIKGTIRAMDNNITGRYIFQCSAEGSSILFIGQSHGNNNKSGR